MNNENLNIIVNERYKKVKACNKKAKEDFEKYGGIDLLTKYVMSETLAPIEDYENAANIIRDNYHRYISGELLIIGAYSVINWSSSQNELLGILNLMYDYFPEKEKVIVNYLNAYQIYVKDKGYIRNEQYRNELAKSMSFNTPFVYNRCQMAELVNRNDALQYYEDAMKNVIKVYTEQEIIEMPLEHFLNPKIFIAEHILGTHISYVNYETIREKIENL